LISHYVKKVALAYYEGLASPKSLAASILLRNGEWDQLANLEADPSMYLTSEDYWAAASACAFLKKYEPLPTSYDRKAVAESNFLLCEEICFRANRRLFPILDDLKARQGHSDVHLFFLRARKIIADFLGPCPDNVSGRFGPGATFGDRGVYVTIPDKMSSEPTLTTDAWPFLVPWSGTLWARACSDVGKVPKFVAGNRFSAVPKDATKFRGIAIEPSLNVFYQLAYGKVIRSRLRRRGIDLDDGQDIHRRLAMEASRRGHLATLDLKNASDTICRNLVKLLLPARWFRVLDDLRSKKTLFRGKFHVLEKFSSMGNGFTFELETLVFLGLVGAVTGSDSIGKTVFAFGDDLILPTEFSNDVISVLRFCGLETNTKKSFSTGVFRESCGGDFFDGREVRPFFLKNDPDQPFSRIALANGIRRGSDPNFSRWYSVRNAWHECLDGIPTEIRRLKGPKDLGDCVIHCDDESFWIRRWSHGIRYIRCYLPTPRKRVRWEGFAPSVILASAVYGSAYGSGYVIPRNPELDYHIGEVPRS
jgi:hypothetical protein